MLDPSIVAALINFHHCPRAHNSSEYLGDIVHVKECCSRPDVNQTGSSGPPHTSSSNPSTRDRCAPLTNYPQTKPVKPSPVFREVLVLFDGQPQPLLSCFGSIPSRMPRQIVKGISPTAVAASMTGSWGRRRAARGHPISSPAHHQAL